MRALTIFLVVGLIYGSLAASFQEKDEKAVLIVARSGWGARPPTSTTTMFTPVNYVVIHHSDGLTCSAHSNCETTMREIQNKDMDVNGLSDIGYNFGVGGDNRAYEGRGWAIVGDHTPGYNDRSIGICAIGRFTTVAMPPLQIRAIQDLIAEGVALGRISSNYKLIGHRQADNTECPGNKLYDEIKTWPHYVATPTYEDIIEGKHEETVIV